MSRRKTIGFGHLFFYLAAAGAAGCATSGSVGSREALGVAMPQGAHEEGVRAGEARVVGAHVNPRVPVHLASEGGAIAVRFAHPRAAGALVRLDSASLTPVSPEEGAPAEAPTAPSTGAARVVLGDGRFIVCWRRGDPERGYRLMAQAWTASGSPLGEPVSISPAQADVLGAPQLLALDGERAIATFTVTTRDSFELLAVRLEVL